MRLALAEIRRAKLRSGLLDERPGYEAGEEVMELIRNEVKGRGTAAVVVTHDTRMTPYADRTVEIRDGLLVA